MKIYIAEDEPLAAAKLKLFLEKAGVGGDITYFSDGEKLQEALKLGPTMPDVIFLDIQMPNLTGLEFLMILHQQSLTQGKRKPDIIITTAFDQYAIDGFNYGVTDYLLKPYTLDRLRQALNKVHYEPQASSELPEAVLGIRCEGRIECLKVADIVCLVALKDYTQFRMADGSSYNTLGTLSGFEQQLPAHQFARVQRSYIVGLKHVRSYNSQSLILSTGEEVPLGKTYRESFESFINSIR